jgi:hypothetical protein
MRPLQHAIRRFVYGRPVVVVSGLPRSGTSMMMKMLEAGGVPVVVDGIRAADGQNPKGYYELERVKELDKPVDKTWVRDARGRAVKVISPLLEHLPHANNYRVVFMHRDLEEVLASQRKMLHDRGERGGDVDDDQLRVYYERHLRKIKHLLARDVRFAALHVDYGATIQDTSAVAQQVNAFLGGELNLTAMRTVADGALYRNRRG